MKLTDLHLHARGLGDLKPPGNIRTVMTFIGVAAMILLIACINFTNLATARASQRAREVALRKVLGAHRGQLMAQFLGESILMALIGFGLALAIVELALPVYNEVLQKKIALSDLGQGWLSLELAGLIVLVGVIAGVYPALYLSRFLPARILKANKSAAAEGSGGLRAGLVVVQFAISIGLLVCTGVIYAQTIYAKTMDLGYRQDGLLVVRTPNATQAKAVLKTLKDEVLRLPGTTAAALSADVPTDQDENNTLVELPDKPNPQPVLLHSRVVDHHFFSTYQVPVLAGRTFDESHGGDDFTGTGEEKAARGGNIVINSLALGRLGFASPNEAVGKQLLLSVGDGPQDSLRARMTIVGVVGDIYYRSVRDELAPALFSIDRADFRELTVRYEGVSPLAAQEAIGKVWRALAPDAPFKAEFLDKLIAQQYAAEEAQAAMFAAFAGLAIIIACLGLYGLASFSAERRTKEIGIRKVLGARVPDVVRLMVWDFSKPVVVANLIAWPASWFLMTEWLNGFQHRIDLNAVPFLAAGLVALLIAWATVAGQAARVARANPIHALRYE
jgi:putative ABC transport system permease protein